MCGVERRDAGYSTGTKDAWRWSCHERGTGLKKRLVDVVRADMRALDVRIGLFRLLVGISERSRMNRRQKERNKIKNK